MAPVAGRQRRDVDIAGAGSPPGHDPLRYRDPVHTMEVHRPADPGRGRDHGFGELPSVAPAHPQSHRRQAHGRCRLLRRVRRRPGPHDLRRPRSQGTPGEPRHLLAPGKVTIPTPVKGKRLHTCTRSGSGQDRPTMVARGWVHPADVPARTSAGGHIDGQAGPSPPDRPRANLPARRCTPLLRYCLRSSGLRRSWRPRPGSRRPERSPADSCQAASGPRSPRPGDPPRSDPHSD